jgi:leucine dehydrogenase
MFHLLQPFGIKDLVYRFDPKTGLKAVVALHQTCHPSTVGGLRILHYQNDEAAILDTVRLAESMDLKATTAGIPHGGAAAVIIHPEHSFDRGVLLESFARLLNDLDGRFVVGTDMGSNQEDMDELSLHSPHVTCTSEYEDPLDWTVEGLITGMRAALQHNFGSGEFAGRHVAIQGLGKVGQRVARYLADQGAALTLTDINLDTLHNVAEEIGATPVHYTQIYGVEADIFSPCGFGQVLNQQNIEKLRCSIVAGSANAQLKSAQCADALSRKGILYAPDFVINAGAVIYIALQHQGAETTDIRAAVEQIGTRLEQIFETARKQHCSPQRIAEALARPRAG